ncbi:MAG: amidohydrolase, partial [Pseudomonadota bacterium]
MSFYVVGHTDATGAYSYNLIERIDGHAHWGNSAALAFSKQDLSGTWQPDGGEIVRDENGIATGVLIDKAILLIEEHVPAPTDAQNTEALLRAMQLTAEVGLTGMHDAGTSLATWKLLEKMADQEELGVRVYAMADGNADMLAFLCEQGVQLDESAKLVAKSVKLYSDGALGSRGAALLEPYSDDPDNLGILIEPENVLTDYASLSADCGLQVNIHAIGDRGNRVTINTLEAALATANNVGRHRIEHAQVIAPEEFARIQGLDLIASVQPTHATSDMYWAEDRVGPVRIQGAYAWQKMAGLGIPLALGSDFPVERPHPLEGFYAAITRQDKQAWPEDGWYADEVLTREQALHGFTLGAAYAAFQENELGSIEVGKFADFTVLSQDIMTVAADEVLGTQVTGTYIAGKAVFTR